MFLLHSFNLLLLIQFAYFKEDFNLINNNTIEVVDEVKQKAHIQAVEKLRNETVEDFGQDFISNVDEDTYKLVSDQLKKQIKIMCIIITTPKYKQSRVIPQIETWVKRGCTDWVYASSKEDKSIKAIRSYRKDGYEFGYGKTRGGLIWSWKKYGDTFDYYLKADDDSYVVMENLRLFLMNKDPNTDVYEGFKLRISTDSEHPKPYSYHHGGAAYVMSKSVVRKLVEDSFPKRCQQSPSGADDRVIGKCLIDLKIHCPDTRDRLGGLLFMPSTPINFATKFPNAKFDIYSGYNWRKFQKGAKGISQFPISFHHMSGDLMYAVDFLLYTVNVMGIQQRIIAKEITNNRTESAENVLRKMKQFSKDFYYNKNN